MTKTLRKALVVILAIVAMCALAVTAGCGGSGTTSTSGSSSVTSVEQSASTGGSSSSEASTSSVSQDSSSSSSEAATANYAVKVFKLDFINYDKYVEDSAAATTANAAVGATVTGEELVPAGYKLNADKTKSVTVAADGSSVLELYLDPVYTAYTDVFESTDIIYLLEAEPEHVYLDRIELGRKVSTDFDVANGLFSFATESEDFDLEGKISGASFYYFRDTVKKTFANYNGKSDTLKIDSREHVVYTAPSGIEYNGSYDIDPATGRYEFISDSGNNNFEFLLYIDGDELYFRVSDGLEGNYAYGDGELVGGGWSILCFDGFGKGTLIEDDGYTAEYDYEATGADVVEIFDLGTLKLVKETLDPVGGYELTGTFHTADAYIGVYERTVGYRVDTLTLDGFGNGVYHTNEAGDEVDYTGTYQLKKDDGWTVKGYGEYTNVNSWIELTTADERVFKFKLVTTEGDYGTEATSGFEIYNENEYSVKPGRYQLTGESFDFYGTTYVLDENHDAFIYFLSGYYSGSYQAVQLWYGTKGADGEFAYEYFLYAAWYSSGNELYDPDNGYDGLYLTDNGNGTYSFDYEVYDGEVEEYVFVEDESGKLYVDALGDAYYQPADGDKYSVHYTTFGSGLIVVLEFSGIPEGINTMYAVYTDSYTVEATNQTTIYDVTGKILEIAYVDETEGGDVVLVETDDYTFLGILASDNDGNEFVEFIFAGNVTSVSANEFNFVWDDGVWYDAIEYYEDIDAIIDAFGDFQYKVDGKAFYYYDGMLYDLADGANTFVTDGYGSATLTLAGNTLQGSYYLEYTVVIFVSGTEEYMIKPVDDTSFKILNVEEMDAYGLFYETSLSDGVPYLLGSDLLFLDGDGGILYAEVVYSDDYWSYEINERYGTYTIVDANGTYTQQDAGLLAMNAEMTLDGETIPFIIIYQLSDDGLGYYGFFVLQKAELMGEYTAYTDDGAELGTLIGGDGYSENAASFTGDDADGFFWYQNGYMARGFIDDKYYNEQASFTADPEGDLVVFVNYDDDGYVQNQFVFDIDADDSTKVIYRSMFYGTVAEYNPKDRFTGIYMYLDGHGAATMYDAEGAVIQVGEYSFAPELGEDIYLFVGGEYNFAFKPEVSMTEAAISYTYSVYTAKEKGIFVNDDWSVLYFDGFGAGAYIDEYGAAIYGSYYNLEIPNESIYCFSAQFGLTKIYFSLNGDGTFALLDGEFLIRNGVLYVYFGSAENVTIPAEVTEIAPFAFVLATATNVKSIDFNNVQKIDDNAFSYSTSIEEVVSDNILEIGKSAFDHVTSLLRVEIPNATIIDDKAFYGCSKLETVKLGKIEKIGANAFSHSTSLYETPFVLDLTAVENPAEIDLDLTAFQAERGWMGLTDATIFVTYSGERIEGGKILVSGGVDTLNALMTAPGFKGTVQITVTRPDNTTQSVNWNVDLTPFVEFAGVAGETVYYYSFLDDVIFAFENFKIVKYVYDYSYSVEGTVGTFYQDGDKLYTYSYDDANQQYVAEEVGSYFEYEGITAYKAGENTISLTDDNQKTLELTYTVTISASYGLYVDVVVSGAKYDGTEATSVNYSKYYGSITFYANGHKYEGTISSGSLTIVDCGIELVLYDRRDSSAYFRAVLSLDEENNVTNVKIGINTYTSYDNDSYYYDVSNIVKSSDEDNVWTFDYSSTRASYKMVYTPASDGVEAKIEVTLVNYVFSDYSTGLYVYMKIDGGKITQIIKIANYSGEPYDAQDITVAEDGLTATFTIDGVSYALTLIETYSGYGISITKTNYDKTENLFSSDYEYMVTLDVHVGADGSYTINSITSIMLYMTDEYLEFSNSVVAEGGKSVTITLEDGRTAVITIIDSSYVSVEVTPAA